MQKKHYIAPAAERIATQPYSPLMASKKDWLVDDEEVDEGFAKGAPDWDDEEDDFLYPRYNIWD